MRKNTTMPLEGGSRQHLKGACLGFLMLGLLLLLFDPLNSGSETAEARRGDKKQKAWVQGGFKDFSQGQFDDGGSNLYVNAHGIIEMINTLDVNNDGYPDVVLANSHDYIERGPTWVYKPDKGPATNWKRREMANDSGWMSRIVDVDGDGFPDLVVVNGENGVTSQLNSYVYWGGPKGLTGERTELPTVGAYDVAVADINHDGRPDLIFPSAWTDHHNPGRPMPARVYLQERGRRFTDATQQYGITGVGAVSLASADLNKDGFPDLVVANYRSEFNTDTDSFVYWGTRNGFDTQSPLRLPTHAAQQVILADLNNAQWPDIIFTGGNQVQVFWNRNGKFDPADQTRFTVTGFSSMFSVGAVHAAVADLDGDGKNDLILAPAQGIQIRSGNNLEKVQSTLPVRNATWVTAADLDGDGRPDLIVSKYHDGVRYDTESPIFWNGPSGFSAERVTWVPTKGAMGNTAGVLDGEGRPEVVFNNTMSGHCCGVPSYIYLGNKEAKYGVEHRLEFPTTESYQSLVADLDLDGYPEVVFTTSDGLRIFHGGPNGPRPDQYTDLPTSNKVIQDVLVADFNRDGYLDLLAVGTAYDTRPESLAKSSTIFYGSKEGFSPSRSEVLENYGNAAYLADVNRDGYLDVLFVDRRGYVLIYLGGPHGYSKEHTWKVPCPGLETGGALNLADLNKDGWLDLIVSTMGHYTGRRDTLHIFYGSPEGFRAENSQAYLGGYSPVYTAVADFNRDGNLDLITTAYSSPTERVIPAQLFWGNGKTLDFEHPVNLPAESSSAVIQDDLKRDGWIDIVLACHRNDLGHQVNSLIYWNGPEGFSPARVTRLPGLGPHGMTSRDRGNAYTRKPEESYVSPAYDMQDQTATRISWEAEATPPLQLKFQLRWAPAKEGLDRSGWMGPDGEGTYFERSGEEIRDLPPTARWLQYRATFISPYGCGSPRLREVNVELKPKIPSFEAEPAVRSRK